MWKWETEKAPKGIVVIVHNILEHHGRYAWFITHLRRDGYHVIMGDLPGQGQTSRVNRGHIENFDEYREKVLEWIEVAEEYHLPVFLLGVGLGGLIAVNLLEKVNIKLEAVMLISPLFGFQNTVTTRKNFFASSLSSISKDAKFDMNIPLEDFSRDKEIIAEMKSDPLMLQKVSFNWYKSIIESMKETMENIHEINDIPVLIMYSEQDRIADIDQIKLFSQEIKSSEIYIKNWRTLFHELHNEPEKDNVLYYIESFMNNRMNYIGLITEEVGIE